MTPRDFGPPTRAPRELFAELAGSGHRLALVFGSERHGMSNEDVYRCHTCLSIRPTPATVPSISPRRCSCWPTTGARRRAGSPVAPRTVDAGLADMPAVTGLLADWEQALTAVGYLDPAVPRKLMPRLNQLFNRAGLTQDEVHILRGIARAMEKPR